MSSVTTYRIFKAKYARSWADGEGAYLFGGRWNSPGSRVLYSSSSMALALLEVLVHLEQDRIISAYSMATIAFDAKMVMDVSEIADLPRDRDRPEVSPRLREIGDDWIASQRSVVLKVPSVVVPVESNYLVNIMHPDAKDLIMGKPESFSIDERLKKKP